MTTTLHAMIHDASTGDVLDMATVPFGRGADHLDRLRRIITAEVTDPTSVYVTFRYSDVNRFPTCGIRLDDAALDEAARDWTAGVRSDVLDSIDNKSR